MPLARARIPDDSLERSWIELFDRDWEQKFHPALVCFLAFDSQQVPSIVGTGFIVDADKDWVVLATAKHVLSEGVSNAQRPYFGHAPSALFVPRGHRDPTLDPKRLIAVWRGRNDGQVLSLNICYANYNDALDLAVCIAVPQSPNRELFDPAAVVIDAHLPSVGDQIFMITSGDLAVTETLPPSGPQRQIQGIEVRRRTCIRTGIVTARYQDGYRQYRWPCFTTSIPAKAGMSGGFVSRWTPNETVAACGVVCADNSDEASHQSFVECGESVIGCSWPLLGLQVPDQIPVLDGVRHRTIHRKMLDGHLTPAFGIERIKLEDENGIRRVLHADS